MTHSRLAWTLAGVTFVLVALDIVVSASYESLFSEHAVAIHGFPFVEAAVAGCSAMGAVIVSRYARHPIGWILTVIGVVSSVSLVTEAYSYSQNAGHAPGSDAMGSIAGWASSVTGGPVSLSGIAIMFLVAPDGHLLSPRWRYAVWAAVIGGTCSVLGLMFTSPTTYDLATADEQSAAAAIVISLGFLLISLSLVASLVSMVKRMRRSAGEQRQQLRLMVIAVALVAFGLVNLGVVQSINGGHQTYVAAVPLFVAYFCLPLLFAVAVLRYRLYDIEVIINRAFVLAVATAFAAVGYAGLVVGVSRRLNAETETGGFWLSLGALVVVALAFQPLRRSVVRLANRLAYGPRAAPYEALADFSRRLAETPTPQVLLTAVAEAAGRAVSASRATAVLETGPDSTVSAQWPSVGGHDTDPIVVPVRNVGSVLGSIAVSLPRGREIRPAEARLLADLADQAALAFRNAAIEAQLAAHVAELDSTTQRLAESRARIIEADDTARRALESAIGREVLPHLVGLPERLRVVRAADGDAAAVDEVDSLITETNLSLEALRELTRGVFPPSSHARGSGPRCGVICREPVTAPRWRSTRRPQTGASRPALRPLSTSSPSRRCGRAQRSLVSRSPLPTTSSFSRWRAPAATTWTLRRSSTGSRPRADRSATTLRACWSEFRSSLARLSLSQRREGRVGTVGRPDCLRPCGRQAVGPEGGLRNIGGGAAPVRLEVVFVIGRQEQDDRGVGLAAQPASGLDAVDAGQVDVHQDKVGTQVAGRRQRLLAARRRPDDDESVGLVDHRGHGAPVGLLVVDDQDAHVSHGGASWLNSCLPNPAPGGRCPPDLGVAVPTLAAPAHRRFTVGARRRWRRGTPRPPSPAC